LLINSFQYDIITYIFRVFQKFNETSITINHKSSNSDWVCMRIYLPNHKECYKPITQKELIDNARVINVINKIINGE
jgi:ABC-type dipeptide/oligopeptide/nickel transport system ATPase subunit